MFTSVTLNNEAWLDFERVNKISVSYWKVIKKDTEHPIRYIREERGLITDDKDRIRELLTELKQGISPTETPFIAKASLFSDFMITILYYVEGEATFKQLEITAGEINLGYVEDKDFWQSGLISDKLGGYLQALMITQDVAETEDVTKSFPVH